MGLHTFPHLVPLSASLDDFLYVKKFNSRLNCNFAYMCFIYKDICTSNNICNSSQPGTISLKVH